LSGSIKTFGKGIKYGLNEAADFALGGFKRSTFRNMNKTSPKVNALN
jgi:hypothetical protein